MIRGLRGATTVEEDSESAMTQELSKLLQEMIQQNDLKSEDVVTIFFTITPDLVKASPPRIARFSLGWHDVPMFCAQEPSIEGFPPRCIRVLIQFETMRTKQEVHHVYLNQAIHLRPDLQGGL